MCASINVANCFNLMQSADMPWSSSGHLFLLSFLLVQPTNSLQGTQTTDSYPCMLGRTIHWHRAHLWTGETCIETLAHIQRRIAQARLGKWSKQFLLICPVDKAADFQYHFPTLKFAGRVLPSTIIVQERRAGFYTALHSREQALVSQAECSSHHLSPYCVVIWKSLGHRSNSRNQFFLEEIATRFEFRSGSLFS